MNRLQRSKRIVEIINRCIEPHKSEPYKIHLKNECIWIGGNRWDENGKPIKLQYHPLNGINPNRMNTFIMMTRKLYQRILLFNVDLTEWETAILTNRINKLGRLIEKRNSRMDKQLKNSSLIINELRQKGKNK